MGNHKFRFSDMMPNVWFYKLKDMGKPKNHNNTFPKKEKEEPTFGSAKPVPHQQYHHHPRKSYYFNKPDGDRLCNYTPPIPKDAPSKQRIKRRRRSRPTNSSSKLVSSSVSTGCSCRASLESVWTKSDSPLEYYSYSSCSHDPLLHEEPEFRCGRALTTDTFDDMISKSTTCDYPDDIVINVDKASLLRKPNFSDGLDPLFEFELPSVILKPPKLNDGLNNLNKKETKGTARYKRSLVRFYSEDRLNREDRLNPVTVRKQRTSPVRGIRLRINSPRIGSRKVQTHGRKSVSSSSKRNNLSDSFAIVKASFDPHKDFRESMVEMIVENNIRKSKDLEDLLACYLTLNSDEYHDLIIKVFKQILFDLTHDNPSKK